MPEFDAIGRDVFAAADSTFDQAPAGAVKALWAWAGFDKGENPNHRWTVSVESSPDGFAVSARVKEADVFTHPAAPEAPTTADEFARTAKQADPEETATSTVPDAAVTYTSAPNAHANVTAFSAPAGTQITPAPAAEDTPPDAAA